MSAAKYEMRCGDRDYSKNEVFRPGLNPRFRDQREPCHYGKECDVFENCNGEVGLFPGPVACEGHDLYVQKEDVS